MAKDCWTSLNDVTELLMVRPPKKDWSRWISLGLYVGTAGNPEINEEKIASDLYSSHFNALSLHIMSPWDNEGHYPWMFNPFSKVFEMDSPNLEFYDHFEKLCERLAFYWCGIEIGFFDSYFDSKWITSQPFKYHPFRDNDLNKDWGSKGMVKWFYDGVIFEAGAKFLWISWEDVSNYIFKNFKPIPPMGKPIIDYIRRIMAIVAKVKAKYPGFRVRYKTFNETHAMGNSLDEHGYLEADRTRSLGDRAEIQSFVRDLWKEYIKPPMSMPQGYIDYMAFYNGDPHLKTIGRAASDWIRKFRFNLECHYAYTKQQVLALQANGVPLTALLSSDGKKETPEENYGQGDSPYFEDLKQVESLKLPNVDYKLWARYKGPRKWRVGQMMWNWNEFFPLMNQIF